MEEGFCWSISWMDFWINVLFKKKKKRIISAQILAMCKKNYDIIH